MCAVGPAVSGKVQPITAACPFAPGRVLTVTPEAAVTCWGVAYRLEPSHREAILLELDRREQGGYERHTVEFHCAEGARGGSWPALMYVAGPDNPDYLGPALLEEIAQQVRRASGPSGSNLEYVLELHAMLGALGIDDPHVAGLAALLATGPAPAVAPHASGTQPETQTEPRRRAL
jgi:cation transport protein ChaC